VGIQYSIADSITGREGCSAFIISTSLFVEGLKERSKHIQLLHDSVAKAGPRNHHTRLTPKKPQHIENVHEKGE